MQFAVAINPDGTQIIQAGPDAPRYAQCVYCGMTVKLAENKWAGYYYKHTSNLSATECQKLRDAD